MAIFKIYRKIEVLNILELFSDQKVRLWKAKIKIWEKIITIKMVRLNSNKSITTQNASSCKNIKNQLYQVYLKFLVCFSF
jgi:hypothetical protein